MTQRERYLAAAVGGLMLLLVLNYGFKSVISTLHQKEDRVDRAFSDLQSLSNAIKVGSKAAETLGLLQQKSLPSLQEAAEAQYKGWLLNLAEQSGLQRVKVGSQSAFRQPASAIQLAGKSRTFDIHEFTLSGECRLDQALALLAAYYDRDYLHQISSLKFTPTRQTDLYTLDMTSKVVSIAKASPNKEPSLASSGRLSMSLDDYQRVILERSPFSAPNKPPAFATKSQHDVTIGQAWQLDLAANDPEGHGVTFELVTDPSTLPESLTFEGSQFKWKPTEKGEQRLVVRAKDSGWPAMTSELNLVLKAVDPPKPPETKQVASVDPAQQAYLTGLVTGRGGAQGWIRSRTEDLSIDIFEGADIQVGSISARVTKINVKEDFVELETDGVRWTVDMSTSLADAYQNSQVD